MLTELKRISQSGTSDSSRSPSTFQVRMCIVVARRPSGCGARLIRMSADRRSTTSTSGGRGPNLARSASNCRSVSVSVAGAVWRCRRK
jgi:hypothetical protein